jgi:hypothetical protein
MAGSSRCFTWRSARSKYFPERRRTAPRAVGLPEAEEAVLDTPDEHVIVWHVPPREGRPVFSISMATAVRCAGGTSAFARSSPTGVDLWRRAPRRRRRESSVKVRRRRCVAGEIALKSPESNAAKAQSYFERALAVARQQQAKSLELRVSMSLARLWRSQGKQQQARELLGPVYGRFTEGFDTLDLKEAKALLDELHG